MLFARYRIRSTRLMSIVGMVPALVLSLAWMARAGSPTTAPAVDKPKLLIVLAGDSTVTKAFGWGGGFVKHLEPDVTCTNMSKAGRSSRSYVDQGWWAKCLALKPAYVLIQFGHNDQPGRGPSRETDPKTTYTQFMSAYVDQARAAGAKPVLVTSMSRRIWGTDGKIHSNLRDYVDAVKRIAADKSVPLIDLHARSIELYEKLGKVGCEDISPKTEKGFDPTHLNAKGGDIVGTIVADELRRAVPELANDVTP